MVIDIPRAVMLLYKNMHLPNEDEAEFEGESSKKSSSENEMMQKVMGLMQQTQELVTQNQLMTRPPRSPRNRVSDPQLPFIAAMFEDLSITAVTENAPGVAGGNRRMGPDRYTQEGLSLAANGATGATSVQGQAPAQHWREQEEGEGSAIGTARTVVCGSSVDVSNTACQGVYPVYDVVNTACQGVHPVYDVNKLYGEAAPSVMDHLPAYSVAGMVPEDDNSGWFDKMAEKTITSGGNNGEYSAVGNRVGHDVSNSVTTTNEGFSPESVLPPVEDASLDLHIAGHGGCRVTREVSGVSKDNYNYCENENATKEVVATVAEATTMCVAGATPTYGSTMPTSTKADLSTEFTGVASYAAMSSGMIDTVLNNVSEFDTESVYEMKPPTEDISYEITTDEAGLKEGLSIGVDHEPEEYDKELEERLYPLDEVELKRRMKQNAERLKSLTLEEMSTLLNLPVDVLEARRANRDFRESQSGQNARAALNAVSNTDDRDVGGGVNMIAEEILTVYALVNEDEMMFSSNESLSTQLVDAVTQLYDDHSKLMRAKMLIQVFADYVDGDEKTDLYKYVYVVHDSDTAKRKYRPGLVEVLSVNDELDPVNHLTVKGKRVMGSVNGIEAVSAGYIDCTPAEVPIDSGAVASLIDARVALRIGRSNDPLHPCDNSLNGVTGHKINMKGTIDLPLRLGSIEIVRPFVVVSRLHVDAILGTDTLKAFRAVVDLDDSTLTLKTTNEVFQLGSPRVEEYHASKMSATSEKLLVEVCNASTEDVVIRKGTTVAVATLVPEAAFTYGDNNPSGDASSQNQVSRSTREVISAASGVENDNFTWAPQTDNTLHDELEVDFNSSKLSLEQQKLLQDLLYQFKDMLVETSVATGRTDLLEFSIDTGNTPPIKQIPYRVSKAEGDVMESELQQYLSLGYGRPSTSPWASPVLMIRKPDGDIRFCIDYRRLNAVTVKDCYPMPLTDDILDVLGNAKLFSTMDIASGYWNVLMAADSVLTWVFNENNRTGNAKLARWTMEISQLRFKGYHKAGTLMSHVDGLSRLHATTIAAIPMADLLNESNSDREDDSEEDLNFDHDGPVQVREHSLSMRDLLNDLNQDVDSPVQVMEGDTVVDGDCDIAPAPGLLEAREHESMVDTAPYNRNAEHSATDGVQVRVSEEVMEPLVSSPFDEFGLDAFRFVEEQKRTPWILALRAFLEDRALPLDGKLRVRVLQMAPHYDMKNDVLMHLFSSHSGRTKTIDKKGYRPWKNGVMQRMPVYDLSGPFSLVVVDAIGPLVTTPRDNKYILAFADYFTRWVEAFPVKRLDTITFVNLMVDEVVSSCSKRKFVTRDDKKAESLCLLLKVMLSGSTSTLGLVAAKTPTEWRFRATPIG
ncbi:hypothetical protein PHMEG_0003765 [Phytophthora megakarya]|uniref:Reverse transcriptase domain-containing protein n=1 Tax=Phytophthora megakarya TaxID=4795 RepID=A0A225WVK1_9STRA|nr:hypothetical protein PHMEG_0003765 [Phytophthora megakarya]